MDDAATREGDDVTVKELPEQDEPTGEAEPMPDEDEEGDEDEQAEPTGVTSEADMQRVMERLDKEATRHANRVSEIMGEDAQLLAPCPLCWTPGFMWPPQMQPLPPEQVAAVRLALGEPVSPEFLDDPAREQCPQCLGKGMLKTGSEVHGQTELNCRRCNGMGWVDKPGEQGAGNGAASFVQSPNVTGPAAAPAMPPDSYGRPWGHPHYGQDPATVGV